MLRIVPVLVVVAVLGMSCSRSARLPVSGAVTVDGQPLAAGDVSFVPTSSTQGSSAGAPIERGKYSIAAQHGLMPGDYKVTIHAFRGTGKKTWDGMGEPTAPDSQKKFVEQLEQYIPPRYNDATELTASIRAGKNNTQNFNLQLGGSKSPK